MNILVVEQIIIILNYILLISGFIGNTLNFITFNNLKIFRGQQCIFYLIIKSIIDCIHLLLLLISQLSTDIFHYNISQRSIILCKLKLSFYQTFTLISLTTICFVAINQCLSTSYNYRLRIVFILKFLYRFFFLFIGICILHGILFFLLFQIQSSSSSSNCTMNNIDFLRYYMVFDLLIFVCFLPLLVSFIFSYYAYRNVRHLIRPQLGIIRRKFNRQLTTMIFGRVMFLIIVTIPFSFYRIYLLNNQFLNEYNQLILTIVITLFNTNFSSDFYVFSLLSSRYRRQVKYICIKILWNKWFRCIRNRHRPRQNQITTVSYISKIEL